MPRQTLDEAYGDAFARSRDLETWLRWNQETVRRYVEVEGGFNTTMAVIKKKKIVHRNRRPSIQTVRAMWLHVETNPRAKPSAGEVAPGVQVIRHQPAAQRPTSETLNRAGHRLAKADTSPAPLSGGPDNPTKDRALEVRNRRRPQMPEIVRRTTSPSD